MRMFVAPFVAIVVAVAASLSGCAGASLQQIYDCFPNDPGCGRLGVMVTLQAPTYQTPATPLPIGASADVTFQEQRCTYPLQRGGNPPAGRCDPWIPAPVLRGIVQPKANSNASCPMTTEQRAPGVLRFTRTGPGDPIVSNGHVTGFCEILVSDPKNGSSPVDVIE